MQKETDRCEGGGGGEATGYDSEEKMSKDTVRCGGEGGGGEASEKRSKEMLTDERDA